MKKLLLLLTFAVPILASAQQTTPTAKPQNWCGSGSEFAGGEEGLAAWAHDYYTLGKRATVNTKKYLPLCLHLVGNADGTTQMKPTLALDLICDMNNDYRPSNIMYWIDSIDISILNNVWNDPPSGSNAYWTSMLTGHKTPNRVNLYFHGGGGNTGLCGVYHGSAVANGTPGVPDVVNCFGACLTRNNTTVTHEMGHYNAMPHTFYGLEGTGNFAAGATCGTQKTGSGEKYVRTGLSSNCGAVGDKFCDTYPDYNSDRWSCDANGESCQITSLDGVQFKINGKNYMSYADDACADHPFTQNQEDRMHTFIQTQRSAIMNVARVGDTISTQTTLVYPRTDSSSCMTAAELTATGIKFGWNPTPNAVYYVLTISRVASFISSVEDVIVRGTSYTSKKLSANLNYYWRVRPYNKMYFCTGGLISATNKFNTKCIPVGTETIKGLTAAAIVPNPVSEDRFSINLETADAFDTQVNIVSLSGQIVRTLGKQHIEQGETNLEFNVNDLPNGMYMVQMQTETGVKTLRMVIAR